MLLSHKYKFIFLHQPKTAGTSIRETILPIDPQSYTLQYGAHTPAKILKKLLPRRIWNNYFKFAFVRNPWDMVVSHYFYIATTCKDMDAYDKVRHAQLLEQYPDIKDFLKSDLALGGSLSVQDSTEYLYDEKGNNMMDYIGKFEELPESFNHIVEKLNLPCGELIHTNVTNHDNYKSYYDNESRENVRRRMEKSIRTFGYEF